MLQNFVEKKVGVKKIFSITYSFKLALKKSLLLWSVIKYPCSLQEQTLFNFEVNLEIAIVFAVWIRRMMYRGYYMAARRYEISLRVACVAGGIMWVRQLRRLLFECWKYFTSERSERVKYFFNSRREISYLQAAMLCSIYYIITNELPNHFTLIVFWCERRDLLCSHSNGDIFTREDNMLFSQVKISSFRAKAHLVFHWCLLDKVIYLTIIPRVCVGFGYNHLISNKGEWNNCFIKNAFRGIFFFFFLNTVKSIMLNTFQS